MYIVYAWYVVKIFVIKYVLPPYIEGFLSLLLLVILPVICTVFLIYHKFYYVHALMYIFI